MTNQADEWEHWEGHDGNGLPVPEGTLVEGEFRCGDRDKWMVGTMHIMNLPGPGLAWYWGEWDMRENGHQPYDIIRYRIRKSRGLSMLKELIADAPQEVMA